MTIDRSVIIAVVFLIWWFSPYWFQISSVFENLYQLFQHAKYYLPILVILCLFCQKDLLDQIESYFPIRRIFTTIFSDDRHSTEKNPLYKQRPTYQAYQQTYQFPQQTYQFPQSSYQSPQQSYQTPQQAYQRRLPRFRSRRSVSPLTKLKYQLAASQGWICPACQNTLSNNLRIRYLIPLSEGGTNRWENIQVYCPQCASN